MRIVEDDMRQDMCLVLMASWRVKCVDEPWIEVELRRDDGKSLRADVCGALEIILDLLGLRLVVGGYVLRDFYAVQTSSWPQSIMTTAFLVFNHTQ